MIATISFLKQEMKVDLSKPLDISLELHPNSARAWYQNPLDISPVKEGDFVGKVSEGGSVNFNNIFFNPHAHGTHTECLGHISEKNYSINNSLDKYFFPAFLTSIQPQQIEESTGNFEKNDLVLLKKHFESLEIPENTEALVIRTLPNSVEKKSRNYSNTNPPYIDPEAIKYIISLGINHLLIDLPSIDREYDEGRLSAHKTFWDYPEDPKLNRTITEFIMVDDSIPDGNYLLELQIAPFDNDASPSRPILYSLLE